LASIDAVKTAKPVPCEGLGGPGNLAKCGNILSTMIKNYRIIGIIPIMYVKICITCK